MKLNELFKSAEEAAEEAKEFAKEYLEVMRAMAGQQSPCPRTNLYISETGNGNERNTNT